MEGRQRGGREGGVEAGAAERRPGGWCGGLGGRQEAGRVVWRPGVGGQRGGREGGVEGWGAERRPGGWCGGWEAERRWESYLGRGHKEASVRMGAKGG